MKDLAPKDDENIIYGFKKGFDFIADKSNKITDWKGFRQCCLCQIRAFVLKLEKLNLMTLQKYGNRVKYKVMWVNYNLENRSLVI